MTLLEASFCNIHENHKRLFTLIRTWWDYVGPVHDIIVLINIHSSKYSKSRFSQNTTNFNVDKYPTRCNSMQIFIHCKVTLHVSGVTAPIIRSTKNCNPNLRYRSKKKTNFINYIKHLPISFFKSARIGNYIIIIIVIQTSFVSTFSYGCKHFGIPNMCTFTGCTLNIVQEFAWW